MLQKCYIKHVKQVWKWDIQSTKWDRRNEEARKKNGLFKPYINDLTIFVKIHIPLYQKKWDAKKRLIYAVF